jgi:hypothetical protein
MKEGLLIVKFERGYCGIKSSIDWLTK